MIAQDVLNPATSPSAGPKHSVPIRKAAVLGAGVMGLSLIHIFAASI